jgi:AraC-like DNA-binding protein
LVADFPQFCTLSGMSNDHVEQLRALILEQAKGQGFLPSTLPDVLLMRMDRYLPLAPTVYEPCILIVAQGTKVGVMAGKRYFYDTRHCLVLTIPLPMESETFASPEEPFLAMAIKVTQPMVTELLVQMDEAPAHIGAEDGLPIVAVTAETLAATVRLAEALRSPERARVLGPGIVREVVYLLLQGPGAAALSSLAAGHDSRWRIGKVVHRLQTDYLAHIDIATLARDAGMSPSSFHARFKAVTGSTPLHYQKLIRLHKARDLMVNAGLTAQSAAVEVGYESASQFSREFRRLFGDSPRVVSDQLRARLSTLPQTRLPMTLSFS